MFNFESLRKAYPEFIYRSYSYMLEDGCLTVTYNFEIAGLQAFSPKWKFPLKTKGVNLDDRLLKNLIFSLGLVELISYWKCTCSPVVKIIPHGLDSDMKKWWKELYFGGLGEFFYTNKIKTDFESFMTISSEADVLTPSQELSLSGSLVPIGGGKDSAVTLRVLSSIKNTVTPYIINSRKATDDTCVAANCFDSAYCVNRTIDKNLIELNKKGFLNGHTPFSAIVAFSSLISAVINGRKFVVLSNESSANESTVLGEEINHQFSKGEAFESNFIKYQKQYINCGVEYFSLLRPLSEMQIAALFSKYKEYHKIFRSCNAGSKTDIWCCNCPKCLFVFVILSPFLSLEYLTEMFGENLFEKEGLLDTYKQLLGVLPNKPFECVGSRDEVLAASAQCVKVLKSSAKKLPYLLEYFDENVTIHHNDVNYYMGFFDVNHHVPEEFLDLLKSELKENIPNV